MQLRTLLVVAFGPALAVCQVRVETNGGSYMSSADYQGGPSDSLSDDNWAPGFLGERPAQCAVMPRIPQTFTAKRTFFSFFNTIIFEDRHGKEFGFVESWLGDWKNLFGYPGASFYLKAEPTNGDNGIWNINGPTPGQDGTFENNPLGTNQGLAQNEQQAFGGNGNGGNQVQQQQQSTGFWSSFFRDFSANQHHRLAAFMVGNQEPPNGKPWLDQMEIRDCKGQAVVKAIDGQLIFRDAKDSRYYQSRTNTENELIVEDLGQPPVELVRVTMKEPCRPFPPFCAQMGMWNWFIHGYTWEGRIMTAGTSSTLGGLGAALKIKISSGEAEDVRFLTLYSAYQFSNTRWSPFMNIVWWLLFLTPFACCCWRSWWCCRQWGGSDNKAEANEETQKLMQTQEIEMGSKAPEEKRSSGGIMGCCSRRGGRGVAAN